jgi:hypothetical protein
MRSRASRAGAILGFALGLSLAGCASSSVCVASGKVTRGCELEVKDARVPRFEWSDPDTLKVTFGRNLLELSHIAPFGQVGFFARVDRDRPLLDLVPKGSQDEIADTALEWDGETETVTYGRGETFRFPQDQLVMRRLVWNGRTWKLVGASD